ncbi:MAG: bifunctional diaminohydroxyphosphoribosylaminopyrimidine deaminase/5-amino-6-(5-phosphoribosylamino)uracil reductase RibD [Bryobacteraceae bacterium]|nr:bifunctional diaminohydroxyphosphoribosylaminopyrimidine deaminase/5-amino-6-(5-phosphoribosylamino)uracil reductase RibD [Bryobacteraceae bacterium]
MAEAPMAEALGLARATAGETSPNPAVGCVLVRDGVVVGRGAHRWSGVDHAEVLALREAGEQARGATAYVTLEPCAHTGRTGPCADALIAAGVTRVVAAMEDPNPLVKGEGFARLRAAGVAVEIDTSATHEAERLNEAFVHFMRTGRPLVTLKAAVTLDGKIAAPGDNSGWITSERARAHVQRLRHRHDAILTGIGTVLADNPQLNDRSGLPRSRPLLRLVADSQLRLPLDHRMVTTAAGDLVAVTTSAASKERRAALEQRGVDVWTFDAPNGRTNLRAAIERLAEKKYLSLMIEAGSKVNWAALEAGVIDKIFFYYAPKILGGLRSLPVAGGVGIQNRTDAIQFCHTELHVIPPDEFAVEAWVAKGTE